MASCEMCGKEGAPFECIVENTSMNLCKSCSAFGKITKRLAPKTFKRRQFQRPQKHSKRVVDNFSTLVRQAREKKGLTQKEFAQMLSERESIVHKMESKGFKPPIATAKKLERILSISLTEDDLYST